MSNPEFKHLNKKQLRKRVKIFNALVYIAGIIAVASYTAFFITDYRFNWSWLLIGLTYTLFPINLVTRKRKMQKEIAFREERLKRAKESDDK